MSRRKLQHLLELFPFQALGNHAGGLFAFWRSLVLASEVLTMPIVGTWMVFWLQLPALVLAVAVIVIATTALRRARPTDIPRVVELLMIALVRRGKDGSPDRTDPGDNKTTSQQEIP